MVRAICKIGKLRPMKKVWLRAAAAAAIACAAFAAPSFAQEDLSEAPRYGVWGYELGGRDPSVKPGDDFYRFSQGLATDQMQIPADRSRYGNFDKLTTLSEARVRAVLDKAEPNSRIGAYYKSFMDEKAIEALGAKPLAADLAAVKAANTHEALARLQGATTDNFGRSFFNVYTDSDLKDPNRYALYLSQGGLGLPNRDYYLEPQFAEKKKAYEGYIARTLKLAGWSSPEANAKAILDLETKIAEASWKLADQRDPEKTYNPVTLAELEKLAPAFPWKAYMQGAHIADVPRVIASEKSAFPKIAQIYASTPVATLQAWQAYTIADGASPFLSKAFDQNAFEFRNKVLQGQLEQKSRWRRAVTATNGALGEAVGIAFGRHHGHGAGRAAQAVAGVGDDGGVFRVATRGHDHAVEDGRILRRVFGGMGRRGCKGGQQQRARRRGGLERHGWS